MIQPEIEKQKWNKHYQSCPGTAPGGVAQILIDNQHLLPAEGAALDLACGLGGSALFLAHTGLETHAWDLSSVACARLREAAVEAGLEIDTQVRDVEQQPPEPKSFNIIVVRFFLCREIASHLIAALRPGGLLFYETFTRVRVSDSGPKNTDYLLKEGELLTMFADLRPRVYREEGIIGDASRGIRNIAQLVAEK